MSDGTKKAFVLLRVSSSGQTRRAGSEEGYSIEGQRDACQRKAAELGAEVAKEWLAPAESASRGLYRTLEELIEALKVRRDIDYVIVYKLERFARDELTDFAAYAEIKKAGAELVSVTESIDSSPGGMLMHGVLTAINAYYSRDLAVKITSGRVTKAKLGGSPGRVPLGYLNKRKWDGANDIRYVEVDPERAPHVQWAFQAYATGEWSIKALADELYKRGLRTRPTPKRPPRKVEPARLHKLLKNEYFVGVVEFKGVKYEGKHPRIVPEDLFWDVQAVLSAHKLAGDRSRKNPGHYLSGSVFCGFCGSRLMYTKCTGRHGGRFEYLVCSGRHKEKNCDLPYLPVGRAEEFVTAYYEDQVGSQADRIAAIEPHLSKQFERLLGYRQREAMRSQKKIDDVLVQRTQLVESHLANPKAIPLDLLEKKQADLEQELKAAEERLARARGDIESANKVLAFARRVLLESSGIYRAVDPTTRRRWNQSFFTKIFLGPGGVTGAELTDEYAALLREDLAQRLQDMAGRSQLRFGRGSTESFLVELRGLEPLTFALPARRSSS
ncbi:MAG: site-specific recombinase [Solirubrobacterales bacterium]|nr:site-specific recombinase [Solirubrobacterales bacterium]